MELTNLKGIGKTRLEALHAAGICSLRDLLYVFPVRYRDVSAPVSVAKAQPGEAACLLLTRRGEARLSRHGKLSRVTCAFADETGQLSACWFNQPWMREHLNAGTRFTLYGRVEASGAGKRLTNPSLEKELGVVPVYRTIPGVPQRLHQAAVRQALEVAEEVCPETLPQSLLDRYGLWPCTRALRAAHMPDSVQEAAQAQRRFAFEEMLLYQAAVRLMRDGRGAGPRLAPSPGATDDFWRAMPFAPTGAQRRTLMEIAQDLASGRAMARMVQGDVGSGKTAVAMGAMLLCVGSGWQAALMAPTELLARQHYEGMRTFFEAQGYSCGLMVGGLPAAQRREALEKIASGAWRVVVGTHALISRDVAYHRLGLCVTDEQHRFGVAQRTALLHKGGDGAHAPHLLVMSATPIPRSLALVLYGDLDLSVIDELPPGRLPVNTRIVNEGKREAMYGFLRDQLAAGRQAYIVCPLVEEDEDGGEGDLKAVKAHAQELARGPLKGFRVGLTYGGQPSREKTAALAGFAAGSTQVLVATTVIEVGVNVPNATVMIVEDADRYGLAQLHQLRGRVGRGNGQSWCFLMARPNDRLRALAATNDGFEVARADLEQRGPGELLGARQHGAAAVSSGALALGGAQLLYEAARCAEELWTAPELAEEREAVARQARRQLERLEERVSIS